jgi:phosphoserine phosphatase
LPTSQHVLITFRGHDAPGITRDLSAQLALHEADLLDVEQVVIHDLLLLAFLVRFPDGALRKQAIEALTKVAQAKDLIVEERVFTEDDRQRRTSRHTYVVTMLGSQIKPAALERVAKVLASAGVNIEKINGLATGAIATVELMVYDAGKVEPSELKIRLYEVSDEFGIDIAVQRESIFRRSKRLVVMDMDSTLIACEVIDELAAAAGAREKVAAITERAMRGELDFAEALRERVQSLEGLPQSVMDEIAARIPLTPGAETLVEVLHRLGYKTAVISGGFRYFTEHIQKRLGLTYAYANELEYHDGKITGKVRGRIVDANVKAELLEDIARREGIGLDQVIAIGDGANDMKMLAKAGLGIAFNAKRRVREAAHGTISGSLDSILYLLGITERDIENIKQSSWPK